MERPSSGTRSSHGRSTVSQAKAIQRHVARVPHICAHGAARTGREYGRVRHGDAVVDHCCPKSAPLAHETSRAALLRSLALAWLNAWSAPGASAASRKEAYPVTVSEGEVRAFWERILQHARGLIGDDFAAQLVFWDKRAIMPSGAPGDPTQDYQSRRRGTCGDFQEGSPQPYGLCSAPGSVQPDATARICCRHFAYCVPRERFGFAKIDRASSVVVSRRMQLLPDYMWQAMLVHELGHCVDFHVFGGRYRLSDHTPSDVATAEILAKINMAESDPELRADAIGDTLLRPLLGLKLCYNPQTTLQALVPLGTDCAGTGDDGDARFMLHFTHPPLQGSARGVSR